MLIFHAAVTWALVGLMWVVQLDVYPSLALVGKEQLPRFHEAHCRRITWVVAPLMGFELASGVALLLDPPVGVEWWLPWSGAGLIAGNWLATFALAVPQHRRLRPETRDVIVPRLVAANWVRTAAWSARGILVAAMLA